MARISPVPGLIATNPICRFSGALVGASLLTANTAASCASLTNVVLII